MHTLNKFSLVQIYGASVCLWADLMAELRLGDVKLNALASWLSARTPKSQREAVTIFNKGQFLFHFGVKISHMS